MLCRENKAKCGSVCVANHTTPIDIVMLAVDNCFTLVSNIVGELLTSFCCMFACYLVDPLPDTLPFPLHMYTQVGQKHAGFLGTIQKACSLAQRHIWFERKVVKDRKMVADR